MKRREFLACSLFTPLVFVDISRAQETDLLEVALGGLLRLVNSLFRPLNELGHNIDRARYRRALDALGQSIELLLFKKEQIAVLLMQKPPALHEIAVVAGHIKPIIRQLSEEIRVMSFGLRTQFKDQGNQVANDLRQAVVIRKFWIDQVACCAQGMSDNALEEFAEKANASVRTLQHIVIAVAELRTRANRD